MVLLLDQLPGFVSHPLGFTRLHDLLDSSNGAADSSKSRSSSSEMAARLGCMEAFEKDWTASKTCSPRQGCGASPEVVGIGNHTHGTRQAQ